MDELRTLPGPPAVRLRVWQLDLFATEVRLFRHSPVTSSLDAPFRPARCLVCGERLDGPGAPPEVTSVVVTFKVQFDAFQGYSRASYYVWLHEDCYEACPSAPHPSDWPADKAIPTGPGAHVPSLAELRRQIRDSDRNVRLKATEGLRWHQSISAIDTLREAMADPWVNVRSAAAHGLALAGDEAAIPVLLSQLTDSYWAVRKAAAVSLGLLGCAEAQESLERACQDPHQNVGPAAAAALSQLAGPGVSRALLRVAADGAPWARSSALVALAIRADPETREGMVAIVRDAAQPAFVRSRAAEALAALQDRSVSAALVDTLLEQDSPQSCGQRQRRRLARWATPARSPPSAMRYPQGTGKSAVRQ